MPASPTAGMSKLSLECDSDRSRDQSRMQPLHTTGSEQASDMSDWEPGEDDDDEEIDVVSSPTGFRYNISRLSPSTRQTVRALFSQKPAQEPPQISLELCGVRHDPEGSGLFYAFQMHEVVPCSVRIGARDSQRFPTPKCECPDARYRDAKPCKHLIWLFDRISKQALFDHDPGSELTLTEFGYAEELGDPFDQISQIRLDLLADGLRCDTSNPDSDISLPTPARMKEARDMVAAVAGIQPWELDNYRPDLESSYNGNTLIRRGDLGATLFSLILASHSLAEWVRSELNPSDAAVDPFRSMRQRVSRIIDELDAFSAMEEDPAIAAAYRSQGKSAEGPRDVSWAAAQIQHCVRRIEKLVSRCSTPLAEWARSSAARSLVGILKAVVGRRDLYEHLIGNHETDFVYSALDTLVDQSQFVEELEDIVNSICVVYGGRPLYVTHLGSLIERMRSYKPDSASITSGSGIPRTEAPSLTEAPPLAVQDPGPSNPSSSSGVQFLTPEIPTSAMERSQSARGGRGRSNTRGSKRSASRNAPENAKGSKKRA
ncbi:hypothetical protein BT67DRAFT_374064 [Trichocladium antarcticum]|uniref:SWIM-type domain-containing protein n=1 Tax=Trichocladium antarcticum TaxID=1450529 RepID=A0AAN6UPX0_9PEZI|nr:hypothetical protein BT67DRAFT_374064 [Trichocladium antarcticum]